MVGKLLYVIAAVTLLVSSAVISAFAQKTAALTGTIKDAQTGDALPGANVVLVGSGMGATSDIAGKYIVRSVPAGTYTLRVT